MKPRNIRPTDFERILPQDEYILSTTDLAGRITSVNDLFVKFSGYSEAELLHSQHNIVRHPDMPRAVFSLCWDAITEGEEFSGYIKNLSKDGGFYWVYAHILPLRDKQEKIVGFRSVRRFASREAVAKVTPVYAEMLAAEKVAKAKDAVAAGLKVLGAKLAAQRLSYEQWVAKL